MSHFDKQGKALQALKVRSPLFYRWEAILSTGGRLFVDQRETIVSGDTTAASRSRECCSGSGTLGVKPKARSKAGSQARSKAGSKAGSQARSQAVSLCYCPCVISLVLGPCSLQLIDCMVSIDAYKLIKLGSQVYPYLNYINSLFSLTKIHAQTVLQQEQLELQLLFKQLLQQKQH